MHCSSLSSAVTDEDWFSVCGMHLLYGTKPFPHDAVLTLTLSWDMVDVSFGALLPTSSNFVCPSLRQWARTSRGIGLHASIVGEDGLHASSVTNRVVPKSLSVRLDDSSAASSFAEKLSNY